MSKKLPYFQFEPAQYLAGDIQFLSLEHQGLFINLCALYWQRDCQLKKSQASNRFNEDDLLSDLDDNGIISIDDYDGSIKIAFLDEQRQEIIDRKAKLSEAGKKGVIEREKRKKEAGLKPPLSEASTTLKQLDKIRKDKIREYLLALGEELIKHFKLDERKYEVLVDTFLISQPEYWTIGSLKEYPNAKSLEDDKRKHFINWTKKQDLEGYREAPSKEAPQDLLDKYLKW